MTSQEIRKGFLDFFSARNHRIVPSAPVIPHGDPTLLFTNAGMNQFKDVFLGTGSREYTRAADTQKCIRVSGKHNDLEEVGRDTYHHTFFEMLGNWSFGDYYKKEAIQWAWELLTDEWGLEKKRLYATVFESDDEAAALWNQVTDIDPSHILRFGKKDNFWEMGETGPCGPCSEIHIDLTGDLTGVALVNAGDPRVMEIWNLVFIQNNRNDKGQLEDLPAKHVDTGMGFERICAVLQGKSSNYDTDVFLPLIDQIVETTGQSYEGDSNMTAMRVIADHVRMLTFSIADGAIPGNEGRGYVLRRILRRAARFGRTLNMHEPFIYKIAPAVVRTMGSVFPEIRDKQDHIQKVIKAEEEGFNATLDRGLEIFESTVTQVRHSKTFPGKDAFRLYDTFGFPLDLTQLMAEERGLKVDAAKFATLMEEQRERSRNVASSGNDATADLSVGSIDTQGKKGSFIGYDTLETETTVLGGLGRALVLAQSPFYAESGGQVSDVGFISVGGASYRVIDTRRSESGNIAIMDQVVTLSHNQAVKASVEQHRRHNIERNHSATHIVHEALRQVLGTHVHQQGSLVAPDHLRFDFPHFGKITPEEIRAIEEIVNGKIAEDIPVHTEVDVPIEKARKFPNVKMFFGDRYGEIVRVVFIDESFSVEFCGGTHVKSTMDIGVFKIISESSIASGVRRIEAITGDGIQEYVKKQLANAAILADDLYRLTEETASLEKQLSETHPKTVKRITVPSLPDSPREAIATIEKHTLESAALLETASIKLNELKKEVSKKRANQASSDVARYVESAVAVNGIRVVSARLEASSMDELKSIGDKLRSSLGSGVGVLGSVIDQKVALVCVVTDDVIKSHNLQAGKIVGEMARRVGGGGGGRPHLATAGGKDVDRLNDVLESTIDIVKSHIHK